jgi:hypothetical protein
MDRLDARSSRPRVKSPLFFIGKNSQGHWVVQDQYHLRGGLFVDRAEALRFALFENGISLRRWSWCPACWNSI